MNEPQGDSWTPRTPIWHVIFKIKNTDGIVRDYCREEPPLITDMETDDMIRFPTEAETREWAERMLNIYGLHSYRVELW